MTHTLNNLRLVKLQVATKNHECAECTDEIEAGERYMRAALPPTVEAFPPAEEVAQEDAWRHVDKTWTIEKTHELCYGKRYYRPNVAKGPGIAGCGHAIYGDHGRCAEMICDNYVNRHKFQDATDAAGLYGPDWSGRGA